VSYKNTYENPEITLQLRNPNLTKIIKIVRTLIEKEGWNPKEALDYVRITQATWFTKWDTIIAKKLAKKYVLEYERPMNKIEKLDANDWYRFDPHVNRMV
jgi:hypothetical protein